MDMLHHCLVSEIVKIEIIFNNSIIFKFTYNLAWGGGDPHIRTFDGLTYTFNGLGRFILAKSQDQSFEVQSQTNLFTNINNQLISGTFFNGFAMKSLNSPIIEIKLSDSFAQNPYLSKFMYFYF